MPLPVEAVEAVVPPHVRVADPADVAGEIPVVARPEGEVPVVGHQAPPEDAHRHNPESIAHRLEERAVIAVARKDPHATVAAVERVVHPALRRQASGASHDAHNTFMHNRLQSRWMSPFPPPIDADPARHEFTFRKGAGVAAGTLVG